MTTRIEWTEATWNPIVGCSLVSPGCTNCYAMRQAHRLAANPATPQYAGTTTLAKGRPVWTGKVAMAESVLQQPLRRQKPTMYFVNSMGDLFHEDVPDDWIDRVFAVMALTPQHTYQVLTKRAVRMRAYWSDMPARVTSIILNPALRGRMARATIQWPLRNLWLGVSAEDQTRADERIPDLLATPAAVRFISAEPLLGPVDLEPYVSLHWTTDQPDYPKLGCLDWVIVGGESGRGARPMHPDWARSLRDQCCAAGVPFFFKQWGGARPKSGGRLLDGAEHDGMPI